ncbi:MAG: helix-hairpin-helix domain-containing protein [Bacteroidales bacterium]|nr:helix-hairpin-helix domain-containing protein [Bacteroidales bacterium]
MKRFFLSIFLLFCCGKILAQDVQKIVSEILEEAAFSDGESGDEFAQLSGEYIENLVSNPLNINTCTFSDFQNIPFLSDCQIEDILNYRMEYGRFFSLGELKGIPSIPVKNLKILQHFLYAGDVEETKQRKKLSSGTHTVMTTMKTVFEKPGQSFLIRYRYKLSDKIAWGLTSETDIGEKFSFGDKKYGFDFNSVYFRISDCGHLKKLVLGDFSVRFGEGLLYSGGFLTGKFSSGASYAANQSVLKEYTSSDENRFFRGAAAELGFGHFKADVFLSRNRLDAAVDGDSFSSLKTDGYHRTNSELQNKDALTRNLAGMILSYNYKKIKLATACQYYNYDKEYTPERKLHYANTRDDKEGFAFSFNCNYSDKKQDFKTELSFDKDLNPAFIGFWLLKPANFLNFSMLYRNYSKKYLSFTAKSVGENSKTLNEEGVCFGASVQPCGFVLLEAWLDVFRFPWLTANLKMPSSGCDFLGQTTFFLSKKFNVMMRYKQSRKQVFLSADQDKTRGYFRITTKYSTEKNLVFTNFVQWSFYNGLGMREKGYAVYQNFQYSLRKTPLSFSLRYGLFSAPYNARIYAMEDDVTYSFSLPAYYNKGVRYYVNAAYQFLGRFTAQFRLSQSRYFDRSDVTELHVFLKVKL